MKQITFNLKINECLITMTEKVSFPIRLARQNTRSIIIKQGKTFFFEEKISFSPEPRKHHTWYPVISDHRSPYYGSLAL